MNERTAGQGGSMRILVVGSGGREHALTWKIAQSPLVERVYCAPGNAGMAQIAEIVPIGVNDLDALADFAEANGIDLTVVGPEAPLIAGIVDRFEARGLRIFGPNADPAQIEGSKVFAKKLMQTASIPTAAFWICDTLEVARARVRDYYAAQGADAKIVIKADGLAAGKGVVIANNEAEAETALRQMMAERIFGDAGAVVVLEECLVGAEASIMAITDGVTIVPFPAAQDHKRIGEGDTGPNTGGMGAYTPVPAAPPEIVNEAVTKILEPAIAAIAELGIPYRGILYAGVMMTAQGVKAIEFNCRLGDPETQAVLPMLESDIVPLLLSVTDCTLDQQVLKWRSGASVCVVAASGGYPGAYETAKAISGVEAAEADGCLVFQSGVKRGESGDLLTGGGRVLSVTGLGATIMDATAQAYVGMSHIEFEAMRFRRDIAHRALRP